MARRFHLILVACCWIFFSWEDVAVGTPQSEEELSGDRRYAGIVRGHVRDADGKAVSNAKVVVRSGHQLTKRRPPNAELPGNDLGQTETNSAGWFVFTSATEATRAPVIAYAPGYAPTATRWQPGDLEIILDAGQSASGILRDSRGKPISGATMTVIGWYSPQAAQNIVTRSILGLPLTLYFGEEPDAWLPNSAIEIRATSDASGMFNLKHLPARTLVLTRVSCEGFAPRYVWIDTTNDRNVNVASLSDDLLVDNDFIIELASATKVRVAAKSVENNDSLELETVYAQRLNQGNLDKYGPVYRARVVDGGAVAEFAHMSLGSYRVWIVPKTESQVVGQWRDIEINETGDTSLDVTLDSAALIDGKVIDEESKKGIAGATVRYHSTKDDGPRTHVREATTDASGRFRMAVPPQPGQLILQGYIKGYVSLPKYGEPPDGPKIRERYFRDVNPSEFATPTQVTFQLHKSTEVLVKLFDPDGNRLRNVRFFAPHFRGNLHGRFIKGMADDDGVAQIIDLFDDATRSARATEAQIAEKLARGLPPQHIIPFDDRPRILFWDRQNRLAETVELSHDDRLDGPIQLKITMQDAPSISGRVVDARGGPIANVEVRLYAMMHGSGQQIDIPMITDGEGRFEITSVPPRMVYSLNLRKPHHYFDNSAIGWLHIQESRHVDLGNIVGIDYTPLLTDQYPPDISLLKDNEASEKLVETLSEAVKRIPEGARNSWTFGSLYTDYKLKTAERWSREFVELAGRHPNTEFECEQLLLLLSHFPDDPLETSRHVPSLNKARHVLVTQHLHRPQADQQMKLILGYFDTERFQESFQHTRSREWRSYICHRIATELCRGIPSYVSREQLSDEFFAERLGDLERWCKLSLVDFRKSGSANSLQEQFEEILKRLARPELLGNERAIQLKLLVEKLNRLADPT